MKNYTMNGITKQMSKLVDEHVKAYKSDFNHDLKDIDCKEKSCDKFFLWALRDNGTHLVCLPARTEARYIWLNNNIRENYCFGSKRPRDILKDTINQFDCDGWKNSKQIYCFRFGSLKKIDARELRGIYLDELKSYFREAEALLIK